MEERVVKFSNRKGSRIEIIYFEDDITIMVNTKKRSNRKSDYESMPVTKDCLVATFWDYEEILKRVLRYDKTARRWFRRNVKPIVIDETGTTLGDFILPNDIVDYKKAKEHYKYKS